MEIQLRIHLSNFPTRLPEIVSYAYFVTMTTPAKIVKVALGAGTSLPTRIGALELTGDGSVGSLELDAEHGYLYALTGVNTGNMVTMQILKISAGAGAALPTRTGSIKLGDYVFWGGTLFLDKDRGLGYAIADRTIIKFSMGSGSATPVQIGTCVFPSETANITAGAVDPATGYAYLGSYGVPAILYKYALSWKDAVHGTKMTLTQKASVNDIRLYSHQAGNNVQMAIYDDNGSARSLKWQSGSISNTQTNGWITSAISTGTPSSLSLNPGTYWLAFNTDSHNNWESFTNAEAGNGFEINQVCGAFPGSITSSNTTEMNGIFSQYITYADYVNLTVASSYGSPSPVVGTTGFVNGSTVNASVTSPVSGGTGIRYVCTGYTGTGSAPSGSGVSCSFTITQTSTLTWNWKTQYQITTAALPSSAGSITPANGAWIDAGAVQSVQASNNTGWQFVSWSGALTGSANPQSLTMNSAKSVTASFNPKLTIASAHGSPNPAVGTSYPNYNSTINASVSSPVSGGAGIRYICTGYTGTGSVTNGYGTAYSFKITNPSTITWNWKTQYQLQYTAGAGGSISGSVMQYVDSGSNGTQVTAVPNSGFHFAKWSDNVLTASRTDLSVAAPINVTAIFSPTLVVNSIHGSPSPSGTTYPVVGSTVNASVSSPISGSAGIQYNCTGYTGTGDAPSGSGTSFSFSINNPSTITWNWKEQYHFLYDVTSGGSISGNADQYVNVGESSSEVTAIPNPGWSFVKWSDNLMSASRIDGGAAAPLTVTAYFNPQLVVNSTYGAPSPSGTTTPDLGSTVSASVLSPILTEDVNARYRCTGYTGTGSAPSGSSNTCSFLIMQPSSITWNWKLQFLFTYLAGAHGSITGSTSQWINAHENATEVIAVPDSGYHFVKWTDGVMTASRTDSDAVTYIRATAIFAGDAPSSSLVPVVDPTIVGTTTTLNFVTVDGSLGKGIASTSLWVKFPGSGGFLEYGGSAQPGTSGSYNFDFYLGNGRYEFATKAVDNEGNAEEDPTVGEVTLIVNTVENGPFTVTIANSDEITTFPMTNKLDIIIALQGAAPGGQLTVSRTVAHTGPPAFQDADHLINEHLSITPWMLGINSATITWNYDPVNQNGLIGPLNTVFNFAGGSPSGQYSVSPSGATLVIPGIDALYGDWYAGNPSAPYRKLNVISSHGIPNPLVGISLIQEGNEVVLSVDSPTTGSTGIRYVCTGFDIPVFYWHGTETNCKFTIYQDVDFTRLDKWNIGTMG